MVKEADGKFHSFDAVMMSKVEGCTLLDVVCEGAWKKGMPLRMALKIINEVARQLCRLHKQGYVHMDIKEENIMVSFANGEVGCFVLNLKKFQPDFLNRHYICECARESMCKYTWGHMCVLM